MLDKIRKKFYKIIKKGGKQMELKIIKNFLLLINKKNNKNKL